MEANEPVAQLPEFSLVRGGLFYRFCLWSGLSGTELERVPRRILVIVAIAWLPLLLLSLIDSTAVMGKTEIPFFVDAAVQARFLVGLPFLLYGEMFAHRRMQSRVQNFLRRNIIIGDEIPKFRAAIEGVHRVRDSIWVELIIAILVYSVGGWIWRSQMVVSAPSWFATPDGSNLNLTRPGWWFAFVSVPIFQFILARWYARFLIWFWFLWRVSRLRLELIPTHPDRAGGIGFLTRAMYSFGFVLFTQGVMLSGLIANFVLHNDRTLIEFEFQVAGYIIFFVALALVPLAVFVPPMVSAKRSGLSKYGLLATRYTRDFGEKWVDGNNPDREPLIGTPDIQSLADLGNSFQMLQKMRLAPFGVQAVFWLAAVTATPLLPLGLFIQSPGEIAAQLLRVLL